jgi:hypothetical protein
MNDEQLKAAAVAFAGIETKTDKAVADWAFALVVPIIEKIDITESGG